MEEIIMATMTVTRAGRMTSINRILNSIPTRNLGEIERRLNLYLNALEAKRMDATVKPNNITLDDVVAEVKKMRRGN